MPPHRSRRLAGLGILRLWFHVMPALAGEKRLPGVLEGGETLWVVGGKCCCGTMSSEAPFRPCGHSRNDWEQISERDPDTRVKCFTRGCSTVVMIESFSTDRHSADSIRCRRHGGSGVL